jgi:hypothetical protein
MVAYSLAEESDALHIKAIIRHLWHQLTDEEIDAVEDRRDVFFLAVKKKHGVERAQAQIILNEMRLQLDQAA